MSTELLLASGSPRRRELLEQIGVPTARLLCSVDEQVRPGEAPVDYVERVTRDKIRAAIQAAPGRVVLAADTAVVLGDRILGKPVDRADALQMLSALSAAEHVVMTAVAVGCDQRIELVRVDTRVRFRALQADEIAANINSIVGSDVALAFHSKAFKTNDLNFFERFCFYARYSWF